MYTHLNYKSAAGIDFRQLLTLSTTLFAKELRGRDIADLVDIKKLKDKWDTLCAQANMQVPLYSSLASCLVKGFPGALKTESVSLIAPGDLYTFEGEQKFNHKNSYITVVSAPQGKESKECECFYNCFCANNADISSIPACIGKEYYYKNDTEHSDGIRFFLDTGLDEDELSKAQELFDKSRQDLTSKDNARWLVSNVVLGVFPVWVINDNVQNLRLNADNFVKKYNPLPRRDAKIDLYTSPVPSNYTAKANNCEEFTTGALKKDRLVKSSNPELEELFCRIKDIATVGYLKHEDSASSVLINALKLQEFIFLTSFDKVLPRINGKVDYELLNTFERHYSWAACNAQATLGISAETSFRDSISNIFRYISFYAEQLLGFYEPQLSKFYTQIVDNRYRDRDSEKEDINLECAQEYIAILNSYLSYLSAIVNSPEINAVIVEFENSEYEKKQKIQNSKDAWSAIASSGLNF